MPCLLLISTLRFTCGEEKFGKISKDLKILVMIKEPEISEKNLP